MEILDYIKKIEHIQGDMLYMGDQGTECDELLENVDQNPEAAQYWLKALSHLELAVCELNLVIIHVKEEV